MVGLGARHFGAFFFEGATEFADGGEDLRLALQQALVDAVNYRAPRTDWLAVPTAPDLVCTAVLHPAPSQSSKCNGQHEV